jgi:hypothetical protein
MMKILVLTVVVLCSLLTAAPAQVPGCQIQVNCEWFINELYWQAMSMISPPGPYSAIQVAIIGENNLPWIQAQYGIDYHQARRALSEVEGILQVRELMQWVVAYAANAEAYASMMTDAIQRGDAATATQFAQLSIAYAGLAQSSLDGQASPPSGPAGPSPASQSALNAAQFANMSQSYANAAWGAAATGRSFGAQNAAVAAQNFANTASRAAQGAMAAADIGDDDTAAEAEAVASESMEGAADSAATAEGAATGDAAGGIGSEGEGF